MKIEFESFQELEDKVNMIKCIVRNHNKESKEIYDRMGIRYQEIDGEWGGLYFDVDRLSDKHLYFIKKRGEDRGLIQKLEEIGVDCN